MFLLCAHCLCAVFVFCISVLFEQVALIISPPPDVWFGFNLAESSLPPQPLLFASTARFTSCKAKAGLHTPALCAPAAPHRNSAAVKSASAAASHTARDGLITFVLSGVSGQQNCAYRSGHQLPQETAAADLAHFWRSSKFRAVREHFRFCTSPCLPTLPAFLPPAQVRVIGACLRFKAGSARCMLLSVPPQSCSGESWPTIPDK